MSTNTPADRARREAASKHVANTLTFYEVWDARPEYRQLLFIAQLRHLSVILKLHEMAETRIVSETEGNGVCTLHNVRTPFMTNTFEVARHS